MKTLLVCLLLGAAIGGAYWNTLDNAFVFDDQTIIVNNPVLEKVTANPHLMFSRQALGYRPLRTLSYVVDFWLAGMEPWIFHLNNILYHWMTACLVFLVALRLTSHRHFVVRQSATGQLLDSEARAPDARDQTSNTVFWTAGCAALLWALHPIQTESVTYISGRRDILSGLFFFLGLYAFLVLRTDGSTMGIVRRGVWGVVVALAYGLGMLSKEMAATLPVVMFCYDYVVGLRWEKVDSIGDYILEVLHGVGRTIWRYKKLYLPFFLCGVLFTVYYIYAQPATRAAGWYGGGIVLNFLTVARIWVHYLWLLLFPVTLVADYTGAFPISQSVLELSALLALGILGVLFGVILALLRRSRLAAFAGLWMTITILPVSHIIPHHELMAEHYLYIPSFGFCFLLALVLSWLMEKGVFYYGKTSELTQQSSSAFRWKREAIGYGVLAILLIFYLTRTVIRNHDWQDDETLWSRTVETTPTAVRAHYNLGVALQHRNALRQAIDEFHQTIKLDPQHGYAYVALASVYLQRTQIREALEAAVKGAYLLPNIPHAHMVLGQASFRAREPHKAIAAFQRVLELKPRFLPAYDALADVYWSIGEGEKSQEWRRRLVAGMMREGRKAKKEGR